MKKFKLTNGQYELINMISDWYMSSNSEQDFTYAGPAGTGKTSVIPHIMKNLGLRDDEVLFCAYTGKAASVLNQKGFNASTIHSSFFTPVTELVYKDNGKLAKNKYGEPLHRVKFVEKDELDPKIKLIVVDEWSMINEKVSNVLFKFDIPVIASGDEYQLPPITGESPFKNKIKYRLTEITRQNSDSGIIKLATMIRNGYDLPKSANYNNQAIVTSKNNISDEDLLAADIILTTKNKTRNFFNDRIRKLHGCKNILPQVGDKLINRQNNWSMSLEDMPLINGTMGKCISPIISSECDLNNGLYRMDFKPDYADSDYYEMILCDYEYLAQPCGNKTIDPTNIGNKFEYAEAITCHLSQGSEYDSVIYYDEWNKDREYLMRMRYTAITRAKERIIIYR